MSVPVREFAFTNLSLPDTLYLLYIRSGFHYGIVYDENNEILMAKKSAKVGRTTIKGVIDTLRDTFTDYRFIYFPRAVVIFPKDNSLFPVDCLSQIKVNFKVTAEQPDLAVRRLLAVPDIVNISNDFLPPVDMRIGINPPLDIDDDRILIDQEYTNTPLEIIDSLAFDNGQNWKMILRNKTIISPKKSCSFIMSSTNSSIYESQMLLTLPTSYYVTELSEISRNQLFTSVNNNLYTIHSRKFSKLEALTMLCKNLDCLYIIVLPDHSLKIPIDLDVNNEDLSSILRDWFYLSGYKAVDCGRGIIYIYPQHQERTTLMLALNSKIDKAYDIGNDFTSACKQVNTLFSRDLATAAITVRSTSPFNNKHFSYHIPWQVMTPFKIDALHTIAGLARKVDASVIITETDGKIDAEIAPKMPEHDGIFIMKIIERQVTEE
jgi:hypothetical protein